MNTLKHELFIKPNHDVKLTASEAAKLDSLYHDNVVFIRCVAEIAASRGIPFPPMQEFEFQDFAEPTTVN